MSVSEQDAKFYALLDMCENIAKRADTAISQLEATRATLEAGEGKRTANFSEALHQLNESEAQRKSEFEQWKSDQAQEWQNWQKDQAQEWQTTQAQEWQDWQDQRQQEMAGSIEQFNTSAGNIINVLNQKVQAVDIDQRKFNELVTTGTAQAISGAIGTTAREILSEKFDVIGQLLDGSQEKIKLVNQSIKDLKNNTSYGLETSIANKVEAGVTAGLTAGLDQAEAQIVEKFVEIEEAGGRVASNFSTSFDTTIKNAEQALTEATSSSVSKIRGAEKSAIEASEKTRTAISKIVHIANDTVETVKTYHDKLLNRQHWKWLIGWTTFLTLFVVIASIITYKMNVPSPDELAERKQQLALLNNQVLEMQQKMQRSTSQYQDGKLYYSVDKSDCHDSFGKNFCVVK